MTTDEIRATIALRWPESDAYCAEAFTVYEDCPIPAGSTWVHRDWQHPCGHVEQHTLTIEPAEPHTQQLIECFVNMTIGDVPCTLEHKT